MAQWWMVVVPASMRMNIVRQHGASATSCPLAECCPIKLLVRSDIASYLILAGLKTNGGIEGQRDDVIGTKANRLYLLGVVNKIDPLGLLGLLIFCTFSCSGHCIG
jgi:hypothetical protein